MKLIKSLSVFLILICSNSSLLCEQYVYADSIDKNDISASKEDMNQFSDKNIQSIYDEGVRVGIINKNTFPFEVWKVFEKEEWREHYLIPQSKGMLDPNVKYSDWLRANNYGVFKTGKSDLEEAGSFPTVEFYTAGQNQNLNAFCNTVRKGDILICKNNTVSLSSFIGHAAIATTDNIILEMPGGFNPFQWKNNNRQMDKKSWISSHIQNDWVTVWRIRDRNLAARAADWADWRFYSSTHGYTKDRYVDYNLVTPIYGDFGHAYCTKLVYDGYFYGTGSVNVMKNYSGGRIPLSPYALTNYINGGYGLTNKGSY